MGDKTYTTKCGRHTYQYLPDSFFEGTKDEVELRTSTLDDAVNYVHYQWFQVSQKLSEYLKEKYHIDNRPGGIGGYSAIFKNVEIYIEFLSGNLHTTIGVFTTPEKDITNEFLAELNAPAQGVNFGLHKMLDPNYGGRVTKEYMDAAESIIYG